MEARSEKIAETAALAARGLREGTLTLAQVAGLDAAELGALAELAQHLRRQGDLDAAADVVGLLMVYDPYTPAHWKSMATLQQRLGNLAHAALCYEFLALLEGRQPETTRRQLQCLEGMGRQELVRQLAGQGGAA